MALPAKFTTVFLNLYCLLVCLLASISMVDRSQASQGKPELHILGLFSMSGDITQIGLSAVPVVEMAIGQVNNRTDILPNHTLKMHWRDSQCAVGPGLDGLFDLLYTPPVKHIVLGASCSIVCEPIAEVSPRWNLTQMAYGCSSPSLSDKEKYPTFFRTVTPDTTMIPVRVEMMRLFGWKTVATIHQSYALFSAATDFMMDELADDNVTVLLSASFLNDPEQQMENLKNHDARIISAGFYANAARKVFCEAYKKGMYGAKYAWFSMYWYTFDWWQSAEVDTDCTTEQLLEAINGTLYTGMTYRNPLDERGLAGVSYTELMGLFGEITQGREMPGSNMVPSYYDALWAVAVALDQTVRTLGQMGHPKQLEDFSYDDGDIGDVITESMRSVDFLGMMGQMKFDKSGDPRRIFAIDQQQGRERVTVGYYHQATETSESHIDWVNGGIKWLGGRPPRDATVIKRERAFVSEELYATMSSLGVLGMVTSAFFFVFNIGFRKRRIIKMSSPNINNVILIGCWLGYCTVFLQERPGSSLKEDVLCLVRKVTFTVGFSLAFGALFSKTWRIHRIMTSSKKLATVVIKDSTLMFVVLGLVLVDVLILVVWQAEDPLTLQIKDLPGQVSDSDDDVVTIPQLPICTCDHQMYFTGALYVVQGMMLAFGAFLAWETRKVKVEALNDSKEIGVCIYNVLTLSVLGAAVSLVVEDNINVSYGFTSAIVLVGTTLIQGIIFVPKMLALARGDVGVIANVASHSSGVNTQGHQHAYGGETASTSTRHITGRY